MDLQLSGKRALVTGSSAGIGQGIAAVLAREGVEVIVHGRNAERAQAVARSITETGAKAHVAVGDLAVEDGAKAVVDAVMAKLGGVDILINNAGGNDAAHNKPTDWLSVPAEDWALTTQQNVISTARLILAFVPGMRDRGWGRVINISSAGATEPTPFVANYCAAKAAVNNLTVSLAKALPHSGVTVNTVSPGCIRTATFDEYLQNVGRQRGWDGDVEALEARFLKEQRPLPVDRLGRVEDIGNMVAYLASPLAAFITGANFRVDGGQSAASN